MSEPPPGVTPERPPSPFDALGGDAARIRRLADRFYDVMETDEPELARLHRQGDDGRIHPEIRERFGLFFVGWLGGPQDYVARHGHPRLRMRHAAVPVTAGMGDAWLRCMGKAMDAEGVTGDLRAFLDARLAEVARMLHNTV